jgi:hypothetical protein
MDTSTRLQYDRLRNGAILEQEFDFWNILRVFFVDILRVAAPSTRRSYHRSIQGHRQITRRRRRLSGRQLRLEQGRGGNRCRRHYQSRWQGCRRRRRYHQGRWRHRASLMRPARLTGVSTFSSTTLVSMSLPRWKPSRKNHSTNFLTLMCWGACSFNPRTLKLKRGKLLPETRLPLYYSGTRNIPLTEYFRFVRRPQPDRGQTRRQIARKKGCRVVLNRENKEVAVERVSHD